MAAHSSCKTRRPLHKWKEGSPQQAPRCGHPSSRVHPRSRNSWRRLRLPNGLHDPAGQQQLRQGSAQDSGMEGDKQLVCPANRPDTPDVRHQSTHRAAWHRAASAPWVRAVRGSAGTVIQDWAAGPPLSHPATTCSNPDRAWSSQQGCFLIQLLNEIINRILDY